MDTGRFSALWPLRHRITKLFASLHQPLYRYVLGLVGDEGEAEEIVNDAFLALYREWREGRTIDDVKPWLFRVAHNAAIDRKRHRARAERYESEAWWEFERTRDDSRAQLQSDIMQRERHEQVRAAIASLSTQQRRCLELRAEALTYGAIAATLGIAAAGCATSRRPFPGLSSSATSGRRTTATIHG